MANIKMKKPMLSIIIPTLNEEKCLPKLLKSILQQKLGNYEIIVVDGNSKDKTREIARKFGCKITKGGSPPKARNNGAKAAKGDLLLFIDADILLPNGVLSKALLEFNKKKLDTSITQMKPIGNNILDRIIIALGNFGMIITQFHDPHANCQFILTKKAIHKKLHGFNEKLKLAEDHDYVKRASKLGKFRVLNAKILVSMRRFEKEGRFRLLMKYYKAELMRKLKIKTNFENYDYKFGHFK